MYSDANGIIFTRTLVDAGSRSSFYKRVKLNEFVKLGPGRYVDGETWGSANDDARYRMRISAAVGDLSIAPILGRESAASLWCLPRVGRWSIKVHVIVPLTGGGQSSTLLARHACDTTPASVSIDGYRVTGLARTIVDVAASIDFAASVAMADAALRRTTHPISGLPRTTVAADDFRAELANLPLRHGQARARRVVEFADGRADRPGESVSRANMSVIGVPAPELQVDMLGRSGRRYTVDFYWPTLRLIGEFDGELKYSDPEFLKGRTPHEALMDEKFREDDLRATDRAMTRWGWKVALSPHVLGDHLRRAGLR